ncbi:MAG TPA: hypothetical protein VIH35_06400 [Kiritimatiellia bacterium]
MKLRVNLLKDGETRYQGPVSLRFMIRAGGGTIIAIIVLFVVIAVQRQLLLRHNMKWSEGEWTRLGPRYDEIKKKQDMLLNYKGLLEELQQWGYTNASWHEMLIEVGQIVPPSIQLTKLNVHSTWTFIKPPAPPVKPGSTEPARVMLEIPVRNIKININGRVTGDLADEVVVQFTRNLDNAKGFDELFESLKLQKLYKDNDSTKTASRQFEIEGDSKPKRMQ